MADLRMIVEPRRGQFGSAGANMSPASNALGWAASLQCGSLWSRWLPPSPTTTDDSVQGCDRRGRAARSPWVEGWSVLESSRRTSVPLAMGIWESTIDLPDSLIDSIHQRLRSSPADGWRRRCVYGVVPDIDRLP